MTKEAPKKLTVAEQIASWDEEDLRSILKTTWGCRFIWRFMERCGVFSMSFVPDSFDRTAFNEGRRSVGNTLLSQVIEINPDAYVRMTKTKKKEEDYVRRATESEQRANEQGDGDQT